MLGAGFITRPTLDILGDAGISVAVACWTETSAESPVHQKKHVLATNCVSPAVMELDPIACAASLSQEGLEAAFFKATFSSSDEQITPQGHPARHAVRDGGDEDAVRGGERDSVVNYRSSSSTRTACVQRRRRRCAGMARATDVPYDVSVKQVLSSRISEKVFAAPMDRKLNEYIVEELKEKYDTFTVNTIL